MKQPHGLPADQGPGPGLTSANCMSLEMTYPEANRFLISLPTWAQGQSNFRKSDHSLGRGAFASVRSAVDLNKRRTVALKSQYFQRDDAETLCDCANEVHILEQLLGDCTHVVQIQGAYFDSTGGDILKTVIVMNRCVASLQDLGYAQFAKRRWQAIIGKGILKGLAWVHEHCVIHRDIKPGNIMVTLAENPGEVVPCIADFGASVLIKKKECQSSDSLWMQADRCFTTYSYAAREVLLLGQYFFAADLWSLGVILAEYYMQEDFLPRHDNPKSSREIAKLAIEICVHQKNAVERFKTSTLEVATCLGTDGSVENWLPALVIELLQDVPFRMSSHKALQLINTADSDRSRVTIGVQCDPPEEPNVISLPVSSPKVQTATRRLSVKTSPGKLPLRATWPWPDTPAAKNRSKTAKVKPRAGKTNGAAKQEHQMTSTSAAKNRSKTAKVKRRAGKTNGAAKQEHQMTSTSWSLKWPASETVPQQLEALRVNMLSGCSNITAAWKGSPLVININWKFRVSKLYVVEQCKFMNLADANIQARC
jgi:serine/threonine protein kinase